MAKPDKVKKVNREAREATLGCYEVRESPPGERVAWAKKVRK